MGLSCATHHSIQWMISVAISGIGAETEISILPEGWI
jgi:hypothetical protein